MRIALITDAWLPQTNGVVRTLGITAQRLRDLGHEVCVIEPVQFNTFPCPTYPEIRLVWLPYRRLDSLLTQFAPDAIHIATEATLGAAGRKWCRRHRFAFTTSYHTQFPEYVASRFPIPLAASYAHLRNFHAAAARTMVATPSLQHQLETRGFRNLVRWTRGVDVELFRPFEKNFLQLPRPIAAYVGRVAVEKNIEAFLTMQWQGTKLIIGDGPARKDLQSRFPAAVFTGYKFGDELVRHIAAADVFVFPSRTDTFGLVLLEAMACGLPIAAYPVIGPIDVVTQGVTGVLDNDLQAAARAALALNPADCRSYALQHTWDVATEQFLSNLATRTEFSRARPIEDFTQRSQSTQS